MYSLPLPPAQGEYDILRNISSTLALLALADFLKLETIPWPELQNRYWSFSSDLQIVSWHRLQPHIFETGVELGATHAQTEALGFITPAGLLVRLRTHQLRRSK